MQPFPSLRIYTFLGRDKNCKLRPPDIPSDVLSEVSTGPRVTELCVLFEGKELLHSSKVNASTQQPPSSWHRVAQPGFASLSVGAAEASPCWCDLAAVLVPKPKPAFSLICSVNTACRLRLRVATPAAGQQDSELAGTYCRGSTAHAW